MSIKNFIIILIRAFQAWYELLFFSGKQVTSDSPAVCEMNISTQSVVLQWNNLSNCLIIVFDKTVVPVRSRHFFDKILTIFPSKPRCDLRSESSIQLYLHHDDLLSLLLNLKALYPAYPAQWSTQITRVFVLFTVAQECSYTT